MTPLLRGLSMLTVALSACGLGALDVDDPPLADGGVDAGRFDGADAGDDEDEPDAGRDAGPLPGAPVLEPLGAAVFRAQPFGVTWRPSPDDVASGAVAVRYEVQESADRSFDAGVRTFRVAAPATRLDRVHQGLVFGAAERLTRYYRVRAVTAAGRGPFSNVEAKELEATFRPTYVSVGYRGPNAPPFPLGPDAFTVDDVVRANGTFTRAGAGWLDTTDLNKGHQGHYWYVSNHGPLPRDGAEAARWTPTITRAGRYEVWVSFYRSENRDDHAEYFVTSADGARLGPFVVSQYLGTEWGDTAWVKLGEFSLEAGTAAHVDLDWSAAGRSHSECADAAAFRRL
jgi:hypothetical protein